MHKCAFLVAYISEIETNRNDHASYKLFRLLHTRQNRH